MSPPLPKDSGKIEDFPDFMESCVVLGRVPYKLYSILNLELTFTQNLIKR
jgi:hypothetical protein